MPDVNTHIKSFFNFLEKRDNRKAPAKYKFAHEPESLTPEDLDVKGDLDLAGTKITTLPEGLKVSGDLDLSNTKITSLPEDLKVSGDLYLKNTEITSLPSGIQVGGKIRMTTPPENYPENLADKIYIGGYSLTKAKEIYAEYNSLPDIEIKVGRAVKKGKGREYPYSSLNTAIPSTSFTGRSLRKVLNTLATSFGIDWEKIYITQELKSDQVIGTTEEIYIIGTDSKGREVLYKTDRFNSTLVSDQGKAAISNILTASDRQLSPRAVAEIESKLFPNDAVETVPKLDKKAIKAKLDNPNNPLVRITFGRRTRGGKGIEGKPEDLLPLIQSASQEKVYALGQKLGITWDKMIIYKEDGDTLYALTGKDKTGKEYMIDRAGHGGGSYTKVYSGGGTNLTISQAIDSTPEDYKE